MVHDLRAMCDAVSYVVKNGVEWRALPGRFPAVGVGVRVLPAVERPRPARWSWSAGCGNCCGSTRAGPRSRRHASSTRRCQGARHRPPGDQRYHGGKKITGRGRHLAVDTEGWLLALIVTAASASDKAGAKILLIKLFDAFSTLKIMWADTGYNGAPLATVRPSRRRDHRRGRRPDQPALLPGAATPLGRGADLRLAHALPPPGPRLRAHHRELRGHDLLGHRHHHDQTPDPLRKRTVPGRALGRETPPPQRASCFIYRL